VDSAKRIEDLVGRTDYEIHPEEQADHYHSLEKRVFKENRYLGDIQQAVTADGRSRWIDNRKLPLHDADGEVIGVFGFVRDVTSEILLERELTKSERRNRLFFELVSSLHVIIDLNGRFVDVNNGWSEVLGYQRDEIVDNYIPDFLHPDDAARTLKEIERLARGVTTLHFRNRYRHKSGHYRLIDWSAEYDPAEQLIYAAGNDITDLEATRERLEDLVRIRTEALEKAQRETVESSLAKSRYLADMSHEIHTPVNDLASMLELLETSGLDSRQGEYLEKARSAAQVLLEIITDIQERSRIESGEAGLETRRSDLTRSTADTIEADRGEASGQLGDDSLQRLRGVSVLLVEDDLVSQQFVRELMAREELKVEVAGNGKEALDTLATQSFDLILMDCRMPLMDGYEATRRIRANPALDDTPVLALTANAMKDDITRALDAGMDDHVPKPIIPTVLFSTMARWLERGRKAV
ncbi:MAG: response regulator, partial [Lysobacterales bacterium]